MSHKYYTSSQRAELLLHPGVLSCTEKYLCFTPEFKKQALELYLQEYMVPRRIFQHLGLPLFVTETTLPKNALKDWKNHFKKEGIT